MRWIRGAVAVAAFAAAGLLTVSDATAGKPGGGTPPPAPPGTIYFLDQATIEQPGPTYVLGSMDGSGGSRAVVMRTHEEVRASRQLHGGKRWLLTLEVVAGEAGFRGGVRREVFAVREDGALHVRLTGQTTMEYWSAEWAPDEDSSGATVSMLGRQWTGLSSSDTVVDGTVGLYTAHLTFDGAGNAVGLDADPAFAVFLGTRVLGGHEYPDVQSYSWSPDMTRLVADDEPREQIRVVDIATGAVTPLGPGRDSDWSPDGSKIAYALWTGDVSAKWAIETMNPDGSGRKTVLSVRQRRTGYTSQGVTSPKWSPDGAYLAYKYTLEENGHSWTDYVYRVAPDGSGKTNLTPEVTTGSGGGSFGLALVDWR
jgi:hypothetical protein